MKLKKYYKAFNNFNKRALSISLCSFILFNSITVQASPRTRDSIKSAYGITDIQIDSDWGVFDQGYRFYLVDKNNQVASNYVDFVFNGQIANIVNPTMLKEINGDSQMPIIYPIETLAQYLGVSMYEIPLAVGYAINEDGSKYYKPYIIDNKAAITAYLTEGKTVAGTEYVYADNYLNKTLIYNNRAIAYNNIKEAVKDVESNLNSGATSTPKTIYIRARDKEYREYIKTKLPLCLVGVSTIGTKPVVAQMSAEDNNNPELLINGTYTRCTLMFPYGLAKDIDLINRGVYSKCQEVAVQMASTGQIDPDDGQAAVPATAYAVHMEDPYNRTNKLMELDNCTIISHGNQSVGMGTRKGGKIIFKNCKIVAAIEGAGSLFMHDAMVPDRSAMGEFDVTLEGSTLQVMNEFWPVVTLQSFARGGLYETDNGSLTTNFGNYSFLNTELRKTKGDNNITINTYLTNQEITANGTVLNNYSTVKGNLQSLFGTNNVKRVQLGVNVNGIESSFNKFGNASMLVTSTNTTKEATKIKINTKLGEDSAKIDFNTDIPKIESILGITNNQGKLLFDTTEKGITTASDMLKAKIADDGTPIPDSITAMKKLISNEEYRLVIEPVLFINPLYYKDGQSQYCGTYVVLYGTPKEIAVALQKAGVKETADLNCYYLMQSLKTIYEK